MHLGICIMLEGNESMNGNTMLQGKENIKRNLSDRQIEQRKQNYFFYLIEAFRWNNTSFLFDRGLSIIARGFRQILMVLYTAFVSSTLKIISDAYLPAKLT